MTAATPTRHGQFDPWLFVVFILTILMCLPFLHMVYAMGDEGVLLNGAERMRDGELIYRDFFEFLPPGGFIFTAWWLGIAGSSVLSARVVGLLIIAGIACFTYLATRQSTRNAPVSATVTIIWLVASQGPQTQLSHHWLTTCLSMLACYAALANLQHPQRGPYLAFWAGAAAAASMMITPTRGALAWLAAASSFTRHSSIDDRLAYLAGSAIAPGYLFAYLFVHHDITAAYADCFRFTATHYASIQGMSFGFWTNIQSYPLFYLFPLDALLTVFACILMGQKCLIDRRLHVCIAFAMAGFIGCYPRPDIIHISYGAPLAIPLFAYCATSIARQCRRSFVITMHYVVLTLCLPSALSYADIANIALHTPLTATPRGTISIFGDTGATAMIERVSALPPKARYFFYPYLPYASFVTSRQQVSKYDLFTPGYTLPSQYQDTCLSVMQSANYVIIDRRWAEPAWVKGIFPAIKNTNPPETQGFNRALDHGFDLVAVDNSFELRHRNATASPALCTGITP